MNFIYFRELLSSDTTNDVTTTFVVSGPDINNLFLPIMEVKKWFTALTAIKFKLIYNRCRNSYETLFTALTNKKLTDMARINRIKLIIYGIATPFNQLGDIWVSSELKFKS